MKEHLLSLSRSHRSKNLKGDRCAVGGTIIHVESGHLEKKKRAKQSLQLAPPVNLLGSLVHRGGRSGSSDKPPPTLVFVAGWRPSTQSSLPQQTPRFAVANEWKLKRGKGSGIVFESKRMISHGTRRGNINLASRVRASSVGCACTGWWGIAFAPLILRPSLVKYLRPTWSPLRTRAATFCYFLSSKDSMKIFPTVSFHKKQFSWTSS